MSYAQEVARELGDADFREFMYWMVSTEKKRRESESVVNEARIQMVREARAADPSLVPEVGEDGVFVWRAPENVLCAFLPGEQAAHAERVWSLSGNAPSVDEPGVCPEWVEIPAEVPVEAPVEGDAPAETPVDAPEDTAEPEAHDGEDIPADGQETSEDEAA